MHSFLKKALFLFSILLVLFAESCCEHTSDSSDEQNPSSTSTNEPPVDYSSIQEKNKRPNLHTRFHKYNYNRLQNKHCPKLRFSNWGTRSHLRRIRLYRMCKR